MNYLFANKELLKRRSSLTLGNSLFSIKVAKLDTKATRLHVPMTCAENK